MTSASSSAPASCKNVVLDAGPLLSLSPLRGLAQKYWTVPQVLDELKDRRAREHFEQLGLSAGVAVEVRAPSGLHLTKVVEAAKKTGDYSVLSHADLCILALTLALSEEKTEDVPEITTIPEVASTSSAEAQLNPPSDATPPELPPRETLEEQMRNLAVDDEQVVENVDAGEAPADEAANSAETPIPSTDVAALPTPPLSPTEADEGPLYEDPSDEDDGEGEWITPSNVALHKSRALDLLPAASSAKKSGPAKQMVAACMTADFAMQNVLLHLGLNLVGVEGKRIHAVKTWVLRCHACFKICKEATRKFCPSCGNATLLRAAVTVGPPKEPGGQPTMQVHLKKNFQYRVRGTKYSIPAPKPGSAKTGTGDGLILREDQSGFARAAKMDASRREREERKMMAGALARGARGEQGGVVVGSWMDPDWVPEIMSVGAGGKGRSIKGKGDLPTIGYGRKNPNERRRKT